MAAQDTPPGSLSQLIPGLKGGDRRAVQGLWQRYFQPLVRVARRCITPARCRRWREVAGTSARSRER